MMYSFCSGKVLSATFEPLDEYNKDAHEIKLELDFENKLERPQIREFLKKS